MAKFYKEDYSAALCTDTHGWVDCKCYFYNWFWRH